MRVHELIVNILRTEVPPPSLALRSHVHLVTHRVLEASTAGCPQEFCDIASTAPRVSCCMRNFEVRWCRYIPPPCSLADVPPGTTTGFRGSTVPESTDWRSVWPAGTSAGVSSRPGEGQDASGWEKRGKESPSEVTTLARSHACMLSVTGFQVLRHRRCLHQDRSQRRFPGALRWVGS